MDGRDQVSLCSGNVRPLTITLFQHGINLIIHSDAFALNFGYDSWQPNQLQSAYDAAASSGTGFKMFLSFDMLALSCSDDNVVVSNIAKFHNHPAQLKDSQGASWVSTFDGGWCRNNGQWQNIVKNQGIATRFIPAFFNDLTNSVMKQMFPVMNGDFLVSWRLCCAS